MENGTFGRSGAHRKGWLPAKCGLAFPHVYPQFVSSRNIRLDLLNPAQG